MRAQRILIVNPFGIGDVLFTVPLVRAVRRAFPESRVVYLCNRRTETILRQHADIDDVIVYEKDELVGRWRGSWIQGAAASVRLLRQVGQGRFDLAIDLSLGERYSLVLKLLGVRRRVGFDYRRRGRFLTERLEIDGYHAEHVVEYYRRLLAFIGLRMREDWVPLAAGRADEVWADRWLKARGLEQRGPLVGLVPAGGVSWGIDAPFRRWSTRGFAAVGDALAQRHRATIILFGEAADRQVCGQVSRLMRHPAIDLSGQTSLGQFISLLGRLGLVVCNDGGPLHLAVGRGVRTVSVFGPVDAAVYGPYPPDARRHGVVKKEGLPCRPCYHRFRLPPCPYERACLTAIEPAEVIEACERVLAPASAEHHRVGG